MIGMDTFKKRKNDFKSAIREDMINNQQCTDNVTVQVFIKKQDCESLVKWLHSERSDWIQADVVV